MTSAGFGYEGLKNYAWNFLRKNGHDESRKQFSADIN